MNLGFWLMAFRPKTLTAALVPVMVGTAMAFGFAHQVNWWVAVFATMSALCIQVGTNLINDAIDFKKGTDTHERIGPIRVTQSGRFSYGQVMWMGSFLFFIALISGVPLVIEGGWPIVIVGIASIFCGYIYTMGPWPLAYVGLGDVFVILFFGLVAVGGVYYLHVHALSYEVLLAGLQIGFLATALIAVNNLRDIEGDKKNNKKTLAVRLGITCSRWEITFLVAVPFLLQVVWWNRGLSWATFFPLLSLPIGIKLVKNVWKFAPAPIYNSFLAQSAALHLLFGLSLSIGFWIGK